MTISDIIDSVDVPQCINTIVGIHRQYYSEPGYILDSIKLNKLYTEVVELIKQPGKSDNEHVLKYEMDYDQQIYNLIIEDIQLRDWFKQNNNPYTTISSIQIESPKQLPKESILVELLYELTYYSFPNNR